MDSIFGNGKRFYGISFPQTKQTQSLENFIPAEKHWRAKVNYVKFEKLFCQPVIDEVYSGYFRVSEGFCMSLSNEEQMDVQFFSKEWNNEEEGDVEIFKNYGEHY